ncbi:hypothetical protein K490DRAFT_44807 [Saccharata proteae CBS 121410]|uniref:Thioesterase domain-containing protein n=1 Tax=Saccharata proteae CBS 121410 TaxID=1314787 RepID=A0A9P4HW75_9PEZI|nr:hypothetical protein K490DRAFT_44807 [Saccharata proteae CBS 121410]
MADQTSHPDLHHFTHLPWCNALLADPTYEISLTGSRTPKPSGEDLFIAETLHSPTTVAGWITLKKKPTPSTATNSPKPYPPIPHALCLLSLGRSLTGHARLAHGGLTAALLDELAGILLTVNVDAENFAHHTDRGLDAYTAYLNVSYKKPMEVPAVVLGRAWFDKVEGRKRWVGVSLEDGEGGVFARGECLYIDFAGRAVKL